MSSRPLPIGDPNLDANWDWTQNSWTAYFNNSNGSIGQVTTLNPFIDGSQIIYGNTDVSKADMYPNQGWILVSRDFGSPIAANAYPFVTLYNKYRGILRVCILRTYDLLSSYQQISLSYAPNINYPELFKYAPSILPNDGPIADTKNSTFKQSAITTAGVQEWMIADFDIRGYTNENVIDENLAFNIALTEIAESDITLSSNVNLNSAQPKVSGGGKIDGFMLVWDVVKDAVSKVNPTVGTVMGLVSKVSSASSANGGKTVNLNLLGSIQSNGSVAIKSPKSSFSIYLKNRSDVVGYRAVQNIPWGVFNVNLPIISKSFDPITTWVKDPNGPDYSEVTIGYWRTITFEPNFISKALTLNPAVSNDVSNIEVAYIKKTDTVDDDSYVVGNFLPVAQFENEMNNSNNNTFSSSALNPTGNSFMAFGIKITYTNGTILYQVIPF